MKKSFITIRNVSARRVCSAQKGCVHRQKTRMVAAVALSSEEKQLIKRENCIIHSKRTMIV